MAVGARIIAKIEACLALAASPNEHEAAAAIERARHLMRRYSVGPQQLGAAARALLAAAPTIIGFDLASSLDAAGYAVREGRRLRSVAVRRWRARR